MGTGIVSTSLRTASLQDYGSDLTITTVGVGRDIVFSPANIQQMRLEASGGLAFGSEYVGTDPGAGNMIISGNVGIGTASPSNPLHGATNPATTNTVVDVLRLDRTTSGTAEDGIGAGLVLYAEDASGNIEEAGRINAVFTTAAHATQAGRVDITAMGAATGVHVLSNGNVGIRTTGPNAPLQVGAGTPPVSVTGAYITGTGYAGTAGPLFVEASAGKIIAIFKSPQSDINTLYDNANIGLWQGTATNNNYAFVTFYNSVGYDAANFGCRFRDHDTSPTGDFFISTGNNALPDIKLYVTSDGNVGIGTTVFGATAAGVLALGGTATAPTTSVDLVHLYGQDISAGNRALAVYQESAVIAAAGIASTHKIPVKWNGTVYYLMASDV
jgi:hypothetical protein